MDILECYKALLKTAQLECSTDGYISDTFNAENKPIPVMVKGKRLVLPTIQHLATGNSGDKVIFHPLSENIMHSESDVMLTYRGYINKSLNMTLTSLMLELLTIIASPALHNKLSPEQSELLKIIPECDEKSANTFTRLIKAMNSSEYKSSLINIYLKHTGVVDGKRYKRVGVVSYPFYTALCGEIDSKLYGVPVRAKDIELYKKVFEFIFPGIDKDISSRNRGSDCIVAPYLSALMRTILAVGSDINDLLYTFESILVDIKSKLINSDWAEPFDNLECMLKQIRMIPAQSGNEGSVIQKESNTSTIQDQSVQYQQPNQQTITRQPPPPSILTKDNKLDFGAVLRIQQPQYTQPQQPVMLNEPAFRMNNNQYPPNNMNSNNMYPPQPQYPNNQYPPNNMYPPQPQYPNQSQCNPSPNVGFRGF